MLEWTQLWQVVLVPIGSGLLGFVQNNWDNYMQDNKLDKFEWVEIVKTVLKLGIPSVLLWISLSGIGIDVAAWTAALIPVTAYWTARLFKTNKVTAVSGVAVK